MKVAKVETFAIKAPHSDAKGYWGSRTWTATPTRGSNSTAATAGQSAVDIFPPLWRMRAIYSTTIDCVLIRLTGDDGTVGWGEAKAPVAPEATCQIIEQLLSPVVVGQDPADVVVLWERMYAGMRLRGHLSGFYLEAIAGMDIALYDLLGKFLCQPIHKLLGGSFRNSIPVYGSGLPGLRNMHDEVSEESLRCEALEMIKQGFRSVKIGGGLGIENDLRTVDVVRNAVGENVTIYFDAGGTYDLSHAGKLGAALQVRNVGFFEAPVPPERISDYARLAADLHIPIATDLVTNRHQALEYFKQGGLDLIQPDVCRAGGITELRRIAELADVFGVAFAPHISIGSAIHFAASAQVAAALPNLPVMEYWWGTNPLGNAILRSPLELADGCLKVPTAPGLGIDIIAENVLQYAVN